MPVIGTRIELVRTSDPYTVLKPGERGTVVLVDAVGTVHVKWDSGSSLGLVPGEDSWREVEVWDDAIARQAAWIEENYGVEAADDANYGWYSDETRIQTKVYGYGILTTTIDGQHDWTPLRV